LAAFFYCSQNGTWYLVIELTFLFIYLANDVLEKETEDCKLQSHQSIYIRD